jgi:hypothetical protein
VSGRRAAAQRADANLRSAEVIEDDDDQDLTPAAAPAARRGPSRSGPWMASAVIAAAFLGWAVVTGRYAPGHTLAGRALLVLASVMALTVVIRYGALLARHYAGAGRRYSGGLLRDGAGRAAQVGRTFADGWRTPGQPVPSPARPGPRHAAAGDGPRHAALRPGGRRHARPPAGRGTSAPSWWRQACARLGDLTPDGITDTEQSMMAERAGLGAYAMALDGWADLLVSDVGYDEQSVALIRELSGDLSGDAAKLEAAWRAMALFYEDHIRHADDGEHAPHDGRHFEK